MNPLRKSLSETKEKENKRKIDFYRKNRILISSLINAKSGKIPSINHN